jgi:hypothetical protein
VAQAFAEHQPGHLVPVRRHPERQQPVAAVARIDRSDRPHRTCVRYAVGRGRIGQNPRKGRSVPRQTQPVAADVKALYVDNCLRRLARVLADGGDDNLAALGRSWPQLADELEALTATLALPVREPQP